MRATLESLGALAWRLTVELPSAELVRRVEERLGDLRRTARVPGFRPGKVPAAELLRRYWSSLCREQAERLAQEELRTALAGHALRPVSAPRLVLEDLPAPRGGETAPSPRVIATFETFPTLPEIELSTLEVSLPRATVGEEDVDRMLERLREERAGGSSRPLPEIDAAFVRSLGIADGELATLRQELRRTMEAELLEALAAERVFAVEEALLERFPELELPAALVAAQTEQLREAEQRGAATAEAALELWARRLLAATFLFAEIARQRGLRVDPTRLWQRTRELADRADDPRAELDVIWSDGDRVQEIEEELLRQDVADAVLSEATVTEQLMSFSDLAEHRRERERGGV